MRLHFIVTLCCIPLFFFGQTDSARQAVNIQNNAFRLGETGRKYDSALIELDRALTIWRQLHDTVNEANLLKFRGFILGMQKKFSEAKQDIDKAIQFYTAKNRLWGVAVSQYDLARVYEQELKFDSAFYYDQLALQYWVEQKNQGRVIIINNHLLQVYGKQKKYKEAAMIQQQTEALMAANDIHWQQKLDHYFLAEVLYKKTGEKVKAEKYRQLYENQLKTLKEQHIEARPGHEGF